MNILVLGTAEVVAALTLAGLEGRTIDERQELLEVLRQPDLAGTVKILVVEEQTADLDRDAVNGLKLDPNSPLVVEIPGIEGPAEDRHTPLEMVRRALGIEL